VPVTTSTTRPHRAFTLTEPRGHKCAFTLTTLRGRNRAFTLQTLRERDGAFTLIELLAVIAITAALMLLLAPAFTSLKSAGDITSAAYTIKGVLEQARTYAMANNTYTWVGFYEEDTTSATPSNSPPPYPGKGRIVLAIVAAKDGTTSCQDPNSTTTNRIPLTASLITQVGKIAKIENIHMTDVGAPPSPTPNPTPLPESINARSGLAYYIAGTNTLDPFGYQNRFNSDDTHSPFNQTLYPFSAQGYTFYKTVRFSPRGEANINSTYTMRQFAEIGLKPAHGSTVDNKNLVALQFTGIGGNLKIYRQ